MTIRIVPSIIAKNQQELDYQLKKFKGLVKEVQLDIMDGTFVQQRSNWFAFHLPKWFKYQAHLMIEDPEGWAHANYQHVHTIIANIERVKHPKTFITFIKNKKRKVGFALNPETPLRTVTPYRNAVDIILILTVHPGQYGAKFLTHILEKAEHLAKIFPRTIELDGGINEQNITLGIKAGATAFVVGSYLQKSKDKKKALTTLQKLINI